MTKIHIPENLQEAVNIAISGARRRQPDGELITGDAVRITIETTLEWMQSLLDWKNNVRS